MKKSNFLKYNKFKEPILFNADAAMTYEFIRDLRAIVSIEELTENYE